MFELLVLVAIVWVLAQYHQRLRRLEREVADLNAYSASQWHAPVPEAAAPEPSTEQVEVATLEVEPAERGILYAEARPAGPVDEAISTEVAEPEPAESETVEQDDEPRSGFGFEELFGRRLPIWAGGITLAVAGMLIVKLSIEAGLLSPRVRVISGAIFGTLLIGGAELALRNQDRVGDVRVRQALAGAGLASLYATILVATNLYQLISPGAAMVGMALVTALAMLLSVRFGAPSALLGLVGGLAAPALVGSPEPNVPLLSVYLALAVGGLAALSRNQRWAWLGVSALLGGFGWGIALLVGGALDAPGTISLGLYILLLGIALPALGLAGDRRDQIQLIAGVVGAAQMAALVAIGGFGLLNWGLFGLIAIALGWLATREPKLALLPPIALIVELLLLGAWPDPVMDRFALVAVGVALIQGLMPLKRLWADQGGILDAAQLAAILLGSWIIAMMHFYGDDGSTDLSFGLLALGLAAVAAAIGGVGWRVQGRNADSRFAMIATSSAALLAAAASLLLPAWLAGTAIAAIGLVLLQLGQMSDDRRFEPLAWIFAGAGLIACLLNDGYGEPRWMDASRWGSIAVVAGLFAWRGRFSIGRNAAQFLAPILLYVALAPLANDGLDPLIPPLILACIALVGRSWSQRLIPAIVASTLMILLSAAEPAGEWIMSGIASLTGDPMLVSGVPDVEPSINKLLLPALIAGGAFWAAWQQLRKRERQLASILVAALALVGLHSLFKQIFAIGSEQEFIMLGLAERTVWELLLAGLAMLALRLGRRQLGYALAIAAAIHLTAYSMLLHNPLWAPQQVGAWPIANLLLPTYGVAIALLFLFAQSPIIDMEGAKRLTSAARMLLIVLFAFSALRQLFHGSLLVDPGLGQAEDIGRSLLAIALAIGFLLWGIRSRNRDWRIASLALMLAAVGKVFLLDAAGLEGLTRIGSFIALGFSLIGIGWLYSRHLSGDTPQLANAGSSR